MPVPSIPSIPGFSRLTKSHKFSAAGIATAGAAALAFAVVPGGTADAQPNAQALSAEPVALTSSTYGKIQKDSLTQQTALHAKQAEEEAAAKKAEEARKAAEAKAKADREREAASRSAERAPVAAPKPAEAPVAAPAPAPAPVAPAPAPKPTYANNLDGWIRQSLDIMKDKGIPGSYDGIYRNIMRESSGNPRAINNWDINAINGIPSKGLLQVIDPTFKAYHVEGTSWDIYDPVANITAACNYAADRYGSMDNVNSAY
ncbi:transglycosylase SLT domain-containing protein [Streptomyces sp. SAJ15]|uniref:transglycosylase SLT domain-containing protein n=1 Tax=Streptomyces sp. SAJ15 TaxID=2011095 RepID=UPI00118727C8|nr:transglycosylase SLT domain-containing protein [Streptomyces sp. SAJ15]TVL90702.1 lytic transglycosylase [Streptomyces sp. SAJ15]